jgi:hypothetical protein
MPFGLLVMLLFYYDHVRGIPWQAVPQLGPLLTLPRTSVVSLLKRGSSR